MLFSVVVPVYNVEKYINQCIDSILSQTYKDFEVILVDDGSPDNSGKICDEYAAKDDRVRVLHKQNEGLVCARQDGLSMARGSYIVNVDSDDYIGENLLAEAANAIRETAPDVIAFNVTRFSKNKTELWKNIYSEGLITENKLEILKRNLIYDRNLVGINLSGILYCLVAKIVKRELLLIYQASISKEIIMGEDLAVTAPLIANCSSIYFLDSAEYYYRNNEASIVSSFRFDEIQRYKTLYDYLDKTMGESYRNQIGVYILYTSKNYIFSAAKQFDTYKEYKHFINENIDRTIINRIKDAKVYKPMLKDRIIILLLNYKMWYFVYKYFHK